MVYIINISWWAYIFEHMTFEQMTLQPPSPYAI